MFASLLLPAALAAPSTPSTPSTPHCPDLEPWLIQLDGHPGCISPTLGALRERAIELGQQDCLAEELAFRGLPVPSFEEPQWVPGPPLPEKLTRDPYGLYNSVESENFVIRWGDGVLEQDAVAALQAFEDGWDVQINDMGYPLPHYTDTYKLNVYVGDSAANAPQIYDAPAYQTRDSDGHPMIVMSDYLINYERGRNTAVHEFQHAVQGASNAYSYTGSGAWYYEATASWIEVEVYPEDMAYASSVYGYGFLPWRSTDFFRYATGEWELENFHQYGALIWPRFLTEFHVDTSLIRESWTEASTVSNDPLLETGVLLEEQYGLDIYELFFEFAARNSVWDYTHHQAYVDNLESRESDYVSQRVARTHEGGTGGEWAESLEGTRPERYGTNYIVFTELEGQNLRVAFEGDAQGDEGHDAQWNVQVVYPQGLHGVYNSVPLEDGVGDVWIDDVAGAGEDVWLVVSVVSDYRHPREQFGYRYLVETDYEPEAEDTSPPDVTQGSKSFDEGNCSTAPGAPMAAWAVLAGLAALRRRRAC